MPVPISRSDEAYFAPLKDLKRDAGMKLYLGLVHPGDGVPGTLKRMSVARKFTSDFGIATECGMGRARSASMVRQLLHVHADSARQFDS